MAGRTRAHTRTHFADKWSPALQIRTVLLSIQALLSAPNPDDPLDSNVAEQWKRNEQEAIRIGMCFSLTRARVRVLQPKNGRAPTRWTASEQSHK